MAIALSMLPTPHILLPALEITVLSLTDTLHPTLHPTPFTRHSTPTPHTALHHNTLHPIPPPLPCT